MAVKTKQVKTKVKKKKWFPIVSPEIMGDQVLGESYVSDYTLLNNKYITVNLMNISGDARNQNVNIQFKIDKVQDGKGYAKIVKYELLPTSLKRFVRRGRDKIVDSFTCRTSDNVLVRIKPLFITISLSKKSAQTGVRLQARKALKELIAKNTFDEFMKDVIQNKVQKHLRTILNKVYPLRNCEIRVFKKETEKETLLVKKKGKEEIAEPTPVAPKTSSVTSEPKPKEKKEELEVQEKKEELKVEKAKGETKEPVTAEQSSEKSAETEKPDEKKENKKNTSKEKKSEE